VTNPGVGFIFTSQFHQFHQFHSSSHLHTLLDGLPIFEMGGLVVSGFSNQRFRKLHQENVESWLWHAHFHFCWGTCPDLNCVLKDQTHRARQSS
jgi:hypothetical protein